MSKENNQPHVEATINQPVYTGLKKVWYDRSPVLRFVLLFALFMIIFYVCWATQFFHEVIVANVAAFDARIASVVLNIFGFGTSVTDSTLASPEMSVTVQTGCDGIEAMALFASGVLAYTATRKHKIKGLFYGLLFLFVINIVRVVHLWWTGLYMPNYFNIFHDMIWQIAFILLAILTWAFWISRIRPASPKTI